MSQMEELAKRIAVCALRREDSNRERAEKGPSAVCIFKGKKEKKLSKKKKTIRKKKLKRYGKKEKRKKKKQDELVLYL